MKSNQEIWENLYNEFQDSVGHLPIELFVLSEYEYGGTFLIVSPAFTDLNSIEKEDLVNDIIYSVIGNKDALADWQGNALTPTELAKLSDLYVFQTEMQPYVEQAI